MSIPVPKYTLYDRKDIEVLVAYILYKVGSITKDELMRSTVDHDFVMYFDLICCLFDMEDKGLIICEKPEMHETCRQRRRANISLSSLLTLFHFR